MDNPPLPSDFDPENVFSYIPSSRSFECQSDVRTPDATTYSTLPTSISGSRLTASSHYFGSESHATSDVRKPFDMNFSGAHQDPSDYDKYDSNVPDLSIEPTATPNAVPSLEFSSHLRDEAYPPSRTFKKQRISGPKSSLPQRKIRTSSVEANAGVEVNAAAENFLHSWLVAHPSQMPDAEQLSALEVLTELDSYAIMNYINDRLVNFSMQKEKPDTLPSDKEYLPSGCRAQGLKRPLNAPWDPKRPFSCLLRCGKTFSRKSEWVRHLKISFPQEYWMCPLCQSTFGRKDKFSNHVRNVHRMDSGLRDSKVNDARIIVPFQPQKCGFCGVVHSSWTEWTEHIAKHFQQGNTVAQWTDPWTHDKTFERTPDDGDDDGDGDNEGADLMAVDDNDNEDHSFRREDDDDGESGSRQLYPFLDIHPNLDDNLVSTTKATQFLQSQMRSSPGSTPGRVPPVDFEAVNSSAQQGSTETGLAVTLGLSTTYISLDLLDATTESRCISEATPDTELSESEMSEIAWSDDSEGERGRDTASKPLPKGIDEDEIFLNPTKYFEDLYKLRRHIYLNSVLKIHRIMSLAPSEDMASRLIYATPEESEQNPEMTTEYRDHVHVCASDLSSVSRNIDRLKEAGFNQDSFNVLVQDENRKEVVRLVQIPFELVAALIRKFDDAVNLYDTLATGNGIEQSRTLLNGSISEGCRQLLTLVGMADIPDFFQQPLWSIWYFVVQFLDVAIVAYSGVHIEYLGLEDLNLEDENPPLEQLTIPVRSSGVSLRRRYLRCLGQFLRGRQVWVFHHGISQASDVDVPLYLSTSVDSFADIWGPLWKSSPIEDPGLISSYTVGNGSIIPWRHDAGSDPELKPEEVFCHWMPQDVRGPIRSSTIRPLEQAHLKADQKGMELDHPLGSENQSLAASQESRGLNSANRAVSFAFTGKEMLLIGAKVPTLRRNRTCHGRRGLNYSTQHLKNLGYISHPGTFQPVTNVESTQISVQWGAGGFGPSVAASKTLKTSFRTIKEIFLETWENTPERRNIRVLGKARYGVVVSFCTKNARRTNLFDILSSSTMRYYLDSLQWKNQDYKRAYFAALDDNDDPIRALEDLWEDCADCREEIGRKIYLCLKDFKNTGVSRDGALSALWIPRRDVETLITLSPRFHSWANLLKDSPTVCTMAAFDTECLEFFDHHQGRTCQLQNDGEDDESMFSVFETRLILNPSLAIPQGIIKRRNHGRHHRRYPYRWSVSGIQSGAVISLGSQVRLKVISLLPPNGLLVEWNYSLLEDLKEELIGPLRRMTPSHPIKRNREYVENEDSDIEPIPIFVMST